MSPDFPRDGADELFESAFRLWLEALERGEPDDPEPFAAGLSASQREKLDRRVDLYREVEEALEPTGSGMFSDVLEPRFIRLDVLHADGTTRKTLGRGGMGVVYKVRDRRLERVIALKVLQKKYRGSSEMIARFLDESRISAMLSHTSIPPVYDRGRMKDGRPCMGMRLIEGERLQDRLAQRGSPKVELSDWITVFEQVSLAVAHAHERDILHRDLKTANVMMEDRQVWVIDWGLAKLNGLAMAELRSTGGGTADGSARGTYHSMSPEQARGDLAAIGKPSDVFALGSILCEILTGSPAYTGTPEQIKAKAEAADLDETWTRLRTCEQDADLVRLARKCLRKKTVGRPKDAGKVADAVAAYRQSTERKLRSAQQARRNLVAVVVGSLFLVSLLGWVAIQARRAEQAERGLVAQAEARYQSIRGLTRIAADSRLARLGLTSLQAELLNEAIPPIENYRKLVGGIESDKFLSQALVQMAEVYAVQGDPEKCLGVLTTAENYFDGIVKAGGKTPDREALLGYAVTRAARGVVIGRTIGRTDEARSLLNEAAGVFASLLASGRGNDVELRLRLAIFCNNEANCLRFADPVDSINAYRQALSAFQSLAKNESGAAEASYWLLSSGSNLAIELELAGRWAEAMTVHDETIKLGRGFLDRVATKKSKTSDRSTNPWLLAELKFREAFAVALFNRGAGLNHRRRFGEAEASLREALAVYGALAEQVPKNREFVWSVAMSRSEIGDVLTRDGRDRWNEAGDLLGQSRAWYASQDDGKDNELAIYRGQDLIRSVEFELRRPPIGRAGPPDALSYARDAVAILRRAGDGAEPLLSMAEARILLGDALDRSGDPKASEEWESARLGLDGLARSLPLVPRFRLLLARAECRLAAIADRQGHPADAATLRDRARGRLDAARAEGTDDPALAEIEAELGPARRSP